jgi:intracellular multiplication protein IcmL
MSEKDERIDPLRLVMLRNAFYKDNFRKLTIVFFVSLLLNVAAALILAFGSFHKPQAYYFEASNDGKLVFTEPLSSPVFKNTEVLAWVNQNMPLLFQIDFLNYRRQYQFLREYFTDYGWMQFIKAITPTMKMIINQKYTVSAKPADVPAITSQGVVDGIYSWQVQVPLTMIYALGPQENEKPITYTIIVQRVNNKTGQSLGIAQIVQTA